MLQPYVKDFGILRCPSDSSTAPADARNPDLDTRKEYVSSYTVNGWSEYELKDADVTRPSSWVLLAERNNIVRPPKTWWMFYWWTWQGSSPKVFPPTASPDPAPAAGEDIALKRHTDQANWLYGDGHVKSAPFSALWKPGKENAFWPNPPQ